MVIVVAVEPEHFHGHCAELAHCIKSNSSNQRVCAPVGRHKQGNEHDEPAYDKASAYCAAGPSRPK